MSGSITLQRPFSRGTPGALTLSVLMVIALLTGCSAADAGQGGPKGSDTAVVIPIEPPPVPVLPVTVESTDGRAVEVSDASRIVPVSAGVAEIVFSLGLGDKVVGRDVATTFPQAADLPIITRAHDIAAEGVLSLRPSLVIGDATSGPPEALEQLRRAGIPVVLVPEAWSLDDIAPRIRAVAEAVGIVAAGDALVERTTNDVAAARSSLPGDPPTIAFLYLRGQASIYLLGGRGAGADSLVEALGAVDAGTKAGLDKFTPLTAEAMVRAQPDVILVMDKGLDSVGGVDGLLKLPGIAQTPAGRDRRVVAVDDGLLLTFGPRTGAVLREIAAQVRTDG